MSLKSSGPLLTLAFAVCGGLAQVTAADEPTTLTPESIDLKATPCGDGWRKWESIGNIEGPVAHRERITALAANDSDVWVGTSRGRLLTQRGNEWILQGQLEGVQITGIAVEGVDKVSISTSDGIRRLEREKDEPWQVKEYRYYYEGHPSFVSGGYIPGEDAVRLWGYVDDIYIPPNETTYSPFVISIEHGLFCWGGYGRVWHHYMPHYWGASSPWLDTNELVPHRRPTCMVEDKDGNLWIGTHWDGLIRLNAHARKYHDREPENNKKDGTEFSRFGPKEIGCEFDRVADLAASADHGVWVTLTNGRRSSILARFDGRRWESLTFGKNTAVCVAEIEPEVALVGIGGRRRKLGVTKVTWESRQVERLDGPEQVIRDIVSLSDGRIFAASRWDLYETDTTVEQQPAD